MPIILPPKRLNRKIIFIKGAKTGRGIVDTVTSMMIQSGLPWEKILAGLGGAAWTGLAGYAAKKGLDYFISDKKENMIPVSSAPLPQGTLKNDIPSVKDSITIVNPENHYIDLPNGMKKTTGDIVYDTKPKRVYGGKIKQNKQVNKILNEKSKQILMNMKTGKGIYNI